MAEGIPRPSSYSLVQLTLLLEQHDGDDRSGALKSALIDILEARENAEDAGRFIGDVDRALSVLHEQLGSAVARKR